MICLTGDVHHRSMNSLNQSFLSPSETEVKLSKRYLEIAKCCNLKVTLFITGRAFAEEFQDVKELLKFDNLEIAGHGFNANLPDFYYRFKLFTDFKWGYRFNKKYQKLHKVMTYWGPNFFQTKDIERTLEIIRIKTGITIQSWRNHAYIHNSNTYKILQDLNIKVVSNDIRAKCYIPYRIGGNLVSLPINTLPDHDHIFHGGRTRDYIAKSRWKGDAFGAECYEIKDWFKIVKDQVLKIEKENGIATISAHPECMWLADHFAVFEQLCHFLSQFENIYVAEAKSALEDRQIRKLSNTCEKR